MLFRSVYGARPTHQFTQTCELNHMFLCETHTCATYHAAGDGNDEPDLAQRSHDEDRGSGTMRLIKCACMSHIDPCNQNRKDGERTLNTHALEQWSQEDDIMDHMYPASMHLM